MIGTWEQFGWKPLAAESDKQRRWAWIALAGYALISLVWMLAVDAPWDDDCPTRFFNTQEAFSVPEHFVTVWNRPLFVLLMALPAQLGKYGVAVAMTLLSTLGAWLLWRALEHIKAPNAWLSIPFLLFQPFYFGTSRVALTEPLAAILLCAGFFFLVHRQWRWYALMGGLLPLARLEMSVVLILWVVPLVQARQWKPLLWMALPMACWNVAAGIITGDFNYVLHQTFGADTGKNRYGNTGFGHYFQRYMWVTGPVVFLLLLQALQDRLRHRRASLWIEGQWVLGMMLYVVFSWKLSMGNAAGFLRNLVPLTPLVALLALDGYNSALAALAGKNQKDRWALLGVGIASLVLCAAFFSSRLSFHQMISRWPDYSRLVVMAATVGLGAWAYWKMRQAKSLPQSAQNVVAMLTVALTVGYSLYQEPPGASNNDERQAVGIIANFYTQSELRERPTYANHNWFFWVAGIHPNAEGVSRITKANLGSAPVGSVIVWDQHYSTRLAGDVDAQYLLDHPEFVELLRIGVSNRGEAVVVLEKVGPDPMLQDKRSQEFAGANDKFLPAIVGRAYRLLTLRRWEEALSKFRYPLTRVKNDPDLWFGQGYAQLNLGQFSEAANSLHNAVMLAPRFPSAWFNLGRAYAGAGDMNAGLAALNRAIAFDPLAPEAWYSRGAVKSKVGDLQGAIQDFSQALKFDPNHVQALTNRAAAYAMTKQHDAALRDITRADELKPGDPETMFVRGRIAYARGDEAAGCAIMLEAIAKGMTKAAPFVEKHCGVAAPADSAAAQPK